MSRLVFARVAWCALAAGACSVPRPTAAGLILTGPVVEAAVAPEGGDPPAAAGPRPGPEHVPACQVAALAAADRPAGWPAGDWAADADPDPARVPAPPAVLLAVAGGLLLAVTRWRRPDDADPGPLLPA